MLFNELANFLNKRVKPGAFFVDHRRTFDQRHKCALGVFHSYGGRAFPAFNYYLNLTVVLLLRLQNSAERSHAVNLLRQGFVNGRVVLRS